MIVAEQVAKYYGQDDPVCAVDEVDMTIDDGEKVAIVGKSGSGKSTLLNLLAGLDHPSSGRLTVGDQRLDQLSRREMSGFRLRTVGVVFQAFQLIPHRTALQNVELPLILAKVAKEQRRVRAAHWLDRLGLSHRKTHFPYELSGGEQQRVAIARALVAEPRVLLADEPTGNLDSVTASEIARLLGELCDATGATFVLVTHDQDLAARLCGRRLRMRDGRLEEGAYAVE